MLLTPVLNKFIDNFTLNKIKKRKRSIKSKDEKSGLVQRSLCQYYKKMNSDDEVPNENSKQMDYISSSNIANKSSISSEIIDEEEEEEEEEFEKSEDGKNNQINLASDDNDDNDDDIDILNKDSINSNNLINESANFI